MNNLKKIAALSLTSILISLNAVALADDKVSGQEVMPVWELLGTETVHSTHNPNGKKIEYGFDKATFRRHSSNNDYGFWVAKVSKTDNEVELTYTRISKDKSTYREVQKFVFYLDDGSFKDAQMINGPKIPLKTNSFIYKAPELAANKETKGYSNMNLPMLPVSANNLELKPGKVNDGKWLCFIDDRSSGIDKNDRNKFTLVTYAYNSEERIYYKGIANCQRVDSNKYALVGGTSEKYTYEDKALPINRTNKARWFISDAEADSAIRWYYQMK